MLCVQPEMDLTMILEIKHVTWSFLQKLHGIPDTFGLICKAHTAVRPRYDDGNKRFMAHNKLLRSCMWWGNQRGKWAGNSLLHATLIHPSVRETSPLCTPHLKRARGQSKQTHRALIPGLLWGQQRSPPCSIWTIRWTPQLLDAWTIGNIDAQAKRASHLLWVQGGSSEFNSFSVFYWISYKLYSVHK